MGLFDRLKEHFQQAQGEDCGTGFNSIRSREELVQALWSAGYSLRSGGVGEDGQGSETFISPCKAFFFIYCYEDDVVTRSRFVRR